MVTAFMFQLRYKDDCDQSCKDIYNVDTIYIDETIFKIYWYHLKSQNILSALKFNWDRSCFT